MKQILFVLLLLGYFGSGAQATDGDRGYAGFFYSQVETGDNVENGNLGLVIGGSMDSGPGIEFFYSDTVDKDTSKSTGLPDVRFSSQVWGLLGTYRFGSEVYALLKAGYTFVDVRADIAGQPNEKLGEDGLSYGVGFGVEVGKNGAIELNYLVLPDIEESLGDQNVDVGSEQISLGYNWLF